MEAIRSSRTVRRGWERIRCTLLSIGTSVKRKGGFRLDPHCPVFILHVAFIHPGLADNGFLPDIAGARRGRLYVRSDLLPMQETP